MSQFGSTIPSGSPETQVEHPYCTSYFTQHEKTYYLWSLMIKKVVRHVFSEYIKTHKISFFMLISYLRLGFGKMEVDWTEIADIIIRQNLPAAGKKCKTIFWIGPTLYLQFDSSRFSAMRTLISASAVHMVAYSTSCHTRPYSLFHLKTPGQ